MAIEYSLNIRDCCLDSSVRDLLLEAETSLQINEQELAENDAIEFALYSELLWIIMYHWDETFADLGGYSLGTNASIWFRHYKHDLPGAALQMLRCVLYLIDHMDNDMVLIWQNDKAVLARVGGELVLNKDAAFWQIRQRQDMLRGRRYRMATMRL